MMFDTFDDLYTTTNDAMRLLAYAARFRNLPTRTKTFAFVSGFLDLDVIAISSSKRFTVPRTRPCDGRGFSFFASALM